MSNGPRGQPSLVTALLVVDVQLDFCPGGTLPVPYGDLLIPALNQAIRSAEQCGVVPEQNNMSHPADHSEVPSDPALRVKALESLLIEKGLVDPIAIDELVELYETRVGPRNGAKVVAQACWKSILG